MATMSIRQIRSWQIPSSQYDGNSGRCEMELAEARPLPSKQWTIYYFVIGLGSIYSAIIAFIVFQIRKDGSTLPVYIAGIVIGGIFVFVTAFYFFDNYLIPYANERKTGKPAHQNIYFLVIEWFSPALLLQVFVVFAFIITISHAPFRNGTVFTHPYRYGEIYKQYEQQTTPEAKAQIALQYSGYFKTEGMTEWGPQFDIGMMIDKIPFLIAISFGFLGALIYMLRDIANRYYITDLYSKTLVAYIIRILFAPTLCIVIAYFWTGRWSSGLAPMVFFFIGHFPQRGMQYIERISSKFLNIKMPKKKEAPLELIEGMNDYIIYRFREIGIDDVQNLAFVDIHYLKKNMGYGFRLLCDYVSQAILLVYLKDHMDALRAFGIRDILSFREVITKDNYERIAGVLEIKPEKFDGLLQILMKRDMAARLDYLSNCIAESEQRSHQA
jgi:hypothetical protein